MKLHCCVVVKEERKYRGWCSVSHHTQPWWKLSHRKRSCCLHAVCRSCVSAFGRCLRAVVLSSCTSMSLMLSCIRFALCSLLTHACVFSAFVYLPPPLLTGVIYLSPSVCLSVSGIAQNAAGGCSWNLRIGLHRGTEKSWLNFRIDLEHILDAVEIVSLSVGQL